MKKKEFIELIENTIQKVLREDETNDAPKPDAAAIKTVEDLIDTKDYKTFVKKLGTDISDPKVKALLRYGMHDGLPNDEKIRITRMVVPVKKLKPTQNSIALENSLLWPLTHTDIADTFLKGGTISVAGKDIVTANKGQYIIDGHHRWSELYLFNPEAKLTSQDLNNIPNPTIALKAVQVAIATDPNIHELPVSKNSSNIYELGEDVVKQYVIDNITEEVVNVFKKYFELQDTELEKNKSEIANYIWKNVQLMKKNNQPVKNASDRDVMPQTDDAKNWAGRLEKGLVNFKAPFTTPAETATRNESIVKEAITTTIFATEFKTSARRLIVKLTTDSILKGVETNIVTGKQRNKIYTIVGIGQHSSKQKLFNVVDAMGNKRTMLISIQNGVSIKIAPHGTGIYANWEGIGNEFKIKTIKL